MRSWTLVGSFTQGEEWEVGHFWDHSHMGRIGKLDTCGIIHTRGRLRSWTLVGSFTPGEDWEVGHLWDHSHQGKSGKLDTSGITYTRGRVAGSDSGSYLGVDLHGEEESEAIVGRQAVEFLLELDQPLGGEVDVLEHYPAPRLGGRVDGLVRLTEALRRTWTNTDTLVDPEQHTQSLL